MILDCHTHTPRPDAIVSVGPKDFSPSEGLVYSVGIHPWDTSAVADADFDILETIASLDCVAAIGETGIDRLRGASESVQTELFKKHAEVAEKAGKPLILHVVKAVDAVLALHKCLKPRQAWIWHGFRGTAQMARQLTSHGIYLSLGERFNAEAAHTVADRFLLLETDCSALSITEIAARVASARGADAQALCRLAADNLQRLLDNRDL